MSASNVRLLLVEDDEEDFLLTGKLLAASERTVFKVEWIRDFDSALEALETPYDVCLVDYRLGADSGLAFIERALSHGFRGPLILLTGRGDHDVDSQAMKAGAADYLVKDQLSPQLLERVVRHALERKGAEQALAHSEAQLRQAQKMEAIGSLAAGIAHDFNNLLSIVLSYSELAAEPLAEGDPLRADLMQISEAGLRAAALTKQLLAFSHQQLLQPKVLDLNAVFAKMATMLRRLLGEDIELTPPRSAAVHQIVADPSQVEQVIMNLAVNARDAMPQGGKIGIEVTTVTLDEEFAARHLGAKAGAHVLLSVSDTGTGMNSTTLARVFEPFFTTKELGKGTGLGLATVFGIVRQSGGVICVDSVVGSGTTFSIYFPVAEGTVSHSPEPINLERPSLLGTETILLVEDEESVRSLVRAILNKFGYIVLDAQSGGDALLLCEQHPDSIDLLLTDVVMPRMSGRQLAERLALLRPQLKVLYMSGYTSDAVLRHGVRDATIAFIQKPITPGPLARRVREALDSDYAGLYASGTMPIAAHDSSFSIAASS
jgi:two-component system, cell cycle sensor histidine kinase and response regulator CckA